MAKITLVPGPAPPHKIPQFEVSGDSHPRKSSSEPGELTLNIGFVWNTSWTMECIVSAQVKRAWVTDCVWPTVPTPVHSGPWSCYALVANLGSGLGATVQDLEATNDLLSETIPRRATLPSALCFRHEGCCRTYYEVRTLTVVVHALTCLCFADWRHTN